mgnify:CR=1 FL=1
MAWTLAELAKIETDTLRKSVMDTLLMESDVMQLIPWETIGQLATTIIRIKDLPSVGFRLIGNAYAESTGKFEQAVENISLLGGMIDTDKAIARAKNTIADARAIQQVMKVKAMAYSFNHKFIAGDPTTTPAEFKGLTKRIDQLNTDGYTTQYIDNAGTAGDGILLSTAERNNFLNKLDELIYSINGHSPAFLFMNKKCLLATRAVLRQEKYLSQDKDQFGRIVDMYGTARLVDIGVQADQTTEIITNSETLEDAGAAESTSIYAVKLGEGEFLWGIQQYPMEITDKGLLENGITYRTVVDWPLGLAMVDPRSMARLYAIIPDAST